MTRDETPRDPHDVRGHFPYDGYEHPTDHAHETPRDPLPFAELYATHPKGEYGQGWNDAILAVRAVLASSTQDALNDDAWSRGYDEGFAASERLCAALTAARGQQ